LEILVRKNIRERRAIKRADYLPWSLPFLTVKNPEAEKWKKKG